MRNQGYGLLLAGGLLCGPLFPHAAMAQSSVSVPSFLLETASDERRRGISWSDGAPVLRATASLPVTSSLTLDAGATSLWGDNRHGNADAVLDLSARYTIEAGAFQIGALGSYHLFPGSSGMGYGEVGANLGYRIGPVMVDLFSRYAPEQSSLGGDNLVFGSGLALGIPQTPLTLSAHVARSSGTSEDPIRSRRLRPDGSYWDHGIALDYYRGRWSAGLHYSNSSIRQDAAPHAGASLIARLGLSL